MGWQDAPEVAAAPAWSSAPEVGGPAPSKGERFVKGLRDPIDGGAQLVTKMLPAGVVQAGNRLNNWLAENTGLVGKLPEGGVDQQVREGEAQYQAARGADAGVDWPRLAGNVLSPANVALTSSLPTAAATLPGRIALGASTGAVGGGLNPVTTGDNFAMEKMKQVGAGAAFGGAAAPVVGGVARVVSPRASTNPQVQTLRAEGVRPTVGQTLGGTANRIEEKLTSVPLVGDAIANARRGAAEDLNRAAFDRALAPIGQTLPRNLSGREAVQFTEDAISRGYDQLLPSLTFQADRTMGQNLTNLRQMVSTGAIDPTAATAFERILTNDVLSKLGGAQGRSMTGETLKRVESDLGQQISRLSRSTDADQRLVGDALQQVQAELRQALVRSNPGQAQRLGELNTAWANFKRVQKAASGLGAEDGVFSAAQLQSAVKAADRSKDKARFSEGNALMQDLSEAGKTVLGSKVPDSGTPGRLMVGGGLSFLDPTGIAPYAMGLGAAAYTRPAQNALTYLLTQRPQTAQPVANALRQASPAFGLLGGQMGAQLLE